MRLRTIWILGLLFGISAVGLWYWSPTKTKDPGRPEPKRLSKLLRGPLPVIPVRPKAAAPNVPAQHEGFPTECIEFLNKLRAIDFQTLQTAELPALGRCAPKSPQFRAAQKTYAQACLGPERGGKGAGIQKCAEAAWKLRLFGAYEATRGIDTSTITDMRLLVEKFYALIVQIGNNGEADLIGEFGKIGTQMEKLEPNLPDVAKVQAASGLFNLLSLTDKTPPAEKDLVWQDAEKKAEKALRLNPSDIQAHETSLWIKSRLMESPQALKYLTEFADQHQGLPLGHYYLAMAHAKEKNKPAAIAELRRAVAKDPENKRYSNSLEACLKKETCQFSVGVDFKFSGMLD